MAMMLDMPSSKQKNRMKLKDGWNNGWMDGWNNGWMDETTRISKRRRTQAKDNDRYGSRKLTVNQDVSILG